MRFLWVTFQIFELSRENTDAGIRKVLASLPTGLYETYARILERINKYRKPDVARGIFQWLAVSRRPLSLAEVAESTALQPGRFTWDESYLPTNPCRLIEGCGNLVTHRIEDNSIQFAHSTVLEFLLSSPSSSPTPDLFINELEANLYLAKTCLAYLNFPDFGSQVSRIPEGRRVSAADMTVAEWVPSMVRGNRAGEVMWNMARYCRMPSESHVTAVAVLPPKEPVPIAADLLGGKYKLLDYISTHWIYHCARLPEDDESHWRMFAALVFDRILPFTHLPWRRSDKVPVVQVQAGGRGVDSEVVIRWAAKNRHLALFHLIIITMKNNGCPVDKIPGLMDLCGVACRTGDVELIELIFSVNADLIISLNYDEVRTIFRR